MNHKMLFIFILCQMLLLLSFYLICNSVNNSEIKNEFEKSFALAKKIETGAINIDRDFLFIDSLLKGRDIVLLGEQQHADGSTQQLYSNLIIYLSNKGYNSLYLETSFYDTYRFWDQLEKGILLDFSNSSIYPFWSRSRQTEPLRDFIVERSKSNQKYYLKGIDFQIPTVFPQKHIFEEIQSYLNIIPNVKDADWEHVRNSLTNKFGPVLYFNTRGEVMDRNRIACLDELRYLQKSIYDRPELTIKDSVFSHYLNNIYNFYYAKMYLKGEKYNDYRDSMMFENLLWQIENTKDKKAIIWTANFHAANDTSGRLSLGARLKKKYNDNVLTILTTSYSGSTTNISSGKKQRVNPATILTIENMLESKVGDISFFIVPADLKKDKAQMRFYGYHNREHEWFNRLDAFFFIKNMTPTKY